jgi:predicted Holliday junction resolvase-like endonuclease
METLSFAFGALTMSAIAMMVVVIVGVVKVTALGKKIRLVQDDVDRLSQRMTDNIEELDRKETDNLKDHEQKMDAMERDIDETLSAAKRYTDSRFDVMKQSDLIIMEAGDKDWPYPSSLKIRRTGHESVRYVRAKE